jgi:hypothetical protein
LLVEEEEWLDRLARNPTYADLDVRAEYAKAQREHDDKGRQLTRSRFIGWLSKIEKAPPPRKPYAPAQVWTPPAPLTSEQQAEKKAAWAKARESLSQAE